MNTAGKISMVGSLAIQHNKTGVRPDRGYMLRNRIRPGFWWGELTVGLAKALTALTGIPTITGELRAVLNRKDGTKLDLGVLSRRVVTTAFVSFVVDQLQTETSVFGDFKYHDSGVGTTAEAIGDTAMETTDGESRVAGTQTESAADSYRSVGTIPYTTTKAITEHGVFNDLTAGTLMDRSKFAAVNVVSGDSITWTYTIQFAAGG